MTTATRPTRSMSPSPRTASSALPCGSGCRTPRRLAASSSSSRPHRWRSSWPRTTGTPSKALLDATPLGFVHYGKFDTFPRLVAPIGITRQRVQYFAGNHATAADMFRSEPRVELYAPLRLLFHADDEGKAVFSTDRPTDLFGSFGDPRLTEVGRQLDGKLAAIFEGLGVRPPATLMHTDTALHRIRNAVGAAADAGGFRCCGLSGGAPPNAGACRGSFGVPLAPAFH
jgi:hypothetical protein